MDLLQRHHPCKTIAPCERNGIPIRLEQFTLLHVYGAKEPFVTGTFGGITPVHRADGRALGAVPGPMTARLAGLYTELAARAARAGAVSPG